MSQQFDREDHFFTGDGSTPRDEALLSSLERQLFEVLERPGLTISVAPRPVIKKIPTRVRSTSEPLEERRPEVDSIRFLDLALLSAVKKSLSITARSGALRRDISIRYAAHDPSAYVARLTSGVRRFDHIPRQKTSPVTPVWFEAADIPSVEAFVVDANDLSLTTVDPRLINEQFTSAEPCAACAEPLVSPRFLSEATTAPAAAFAGLLQEQFTAADPEIARRSVRHLYLEPATVVTLDHEFALIEPQTQPLGKEIGLIRPIGQIGPIRPIGQMRFMPRFDAFRLMYGFLTLLLVVSLPAGAVTLSRTIHDRVSQADEQSRAAVTEARTALTTSGDGQDQLWGQVSARFQAADAALNQANQLSLNLVQALPQTRDTYASVHGLLQTGDKTSQAAQLLTQGIRQALTAVVRYPEERLQVFMTYLDAVKPLLDQAQASMGGVHAVAVPKEVQGQVALMASSLAMAQTSLQEMQTLSDFLLAAIGHTHPRTYLLVFQNHTELRPTGGFMGSVAQVTLDRGAIQNVFVPGGGPYDLRSQLMTRALPPAPLRLVDDRWEFQDANWFPDFPASAGRIRRFWSDGGQDTIDGVIAINATLMEKILRVTGPIDMPEYGKTITADNFLLETQKAVELEYDRTENKPKKIIGDLMPKVIAKIKQASRQDLIAYAGLLQQALTTKEVQVWMNDAEEERQVERWGWNGRLKSSIGDQLAVVEANIAGQKTDAVIDEKVTHQAQIQADGSIVDTVVLDRQHLGQKGALFNGVNNVQYLRIYVPQGSTLLAADGFQPPPQALFKEALAQDKPDPDVTRLVKNERPGPAGLTITDEFGRTAFGGWIQLSPGAASRTIFRYRLPFTAYDIAEQVSVNPTASRRRAAYLLLLTSQSGKINRRIDSTVTSPPAWRVSWSNAETTSTGALAPGIAALWDRDRTVASLFE